MRVIAETENSRHQYGDQCCFLIDYTCFPKKNNRRRISEKNKRKDKDNVNTKTKQHKTVQGESCRLPFVVIKYTTRVFVDGFPLQMEFFMHTIRSSAAKLRLAVLFLLAAPVFAAAAEELKPFYVIKVTSPGTLISIAEKIADLAGQTESEEFKSVIDSVKNMTGVDSKGFSGFALSVNEDDELIPLFLFPVTDINIANIPGHEEMFDFIRKNLKKAGKEKDTYTFELPDGAFGQLIPQWAYKWTVKMQKGHLAVVPSVFADSLPVNAEKLFDGIGDDTLTYGINCENIKFEFVEKNILLPMQLFVAQADARSGEQFGVQIEGYRYLFNEISSLTVGVNFDPKTADTACTYRVVPRKGSKAEKAFNDFGKETTIFGGFRGVPAERVCSMSVSKTAVADEKEIELGKKYLDLFFSGIIAALEENEEDEKDIKLAKDVVLSLKNLWSKQAKAGKFDAALSADVNGILTAAVSLEDTKELQKLVKMLCDYIAVKVGDDIELDVKDVKKIVEENLKKEYTTVEGFKISRLQIHVADVLAKFGDSSFERPKDFKPVISVFWAVRENAAVAVAVGEDAEKTEAAFKNALAGTKTAVPVEQPSADLSVSNLGKMLQRVILPKIEKIDPDVAKGGSREYNQFKKGVGMLSDADKSAVVSLAAVNKKDGFEAKYFISGKVITVIANIIKAVNAPELKRDAIIDF